MSAQPLQLLTYTLKLSYHWLRSCVPCRRMLPAKRRYSTVNTQQSAATHVTAPVHNNTASSAVPWIILGLGNGKSYINTRHNIGQDVVDKLSQKYAHVSLFARHNVLNAIPSDTATSPHDTVIKSHKCYYVIQHIAEQLCYIVHTDTYMNNSGTGVKRILQHIAAQHNVTLQALSQRFVLLYDELDLQCGTLRLSNTQHRAGHNGISDVQRVMQEHQQFIRIRLGIGTHAEYDMTDYVLEEFDAAQRSVMDKTVERAIACVEYLVANGLSKSMTRYNKTWEQFEAAENVDTEAIAAQRREKRLRWEQQQKLKAEQAALAKQQQSRVDTTTHKDHVS